MTEKKVVALLCSVFAGASLAAWTDRASAGLTLYFTLAALWAFLSRNDPQ